MAEFLGSPKVQFFDNNGDLLSGGLLYAYETGTTTLKNTYPTIADAIALTNANANPVVLDSRGEANVVLVGATKLVLKNSDATVTYWTVDNITQSTTVIDDNGNELLKFSQTASAVNEVTITNAATGNPPVISATGGDTNIDLGLSGKGTGGVKLQNNNLKIPNSYGLVDGNGNELVMTTQTASAVNQFNITNAATGSAPTLAATGDDTNIGIAFQSKGAEAYQFLGTASQEARIRLYEDTDNGTNYISVRAPAAITSNRTFTLPDCDVPGHYVQHSYTEFTTYSATTTNIPADDTVPTVFEGATVFSTSLTPKATGNIIVLRCVMPGWASSGIIPAMTLSIDGTITRTIVLPGAGSSTVGGVGVLEYRFATSGTSAIAFVIRVGVGSGTFYINGNSGSRLYGGTMVASLLITEYSA